MKVQIPLPTIVIDEISKFLDINYPTITQKNKTSLFSCLSELWLFIWDKHNNEKNKLQSKFDANYIDNIYADISRDALFKFQIKIKGITFKYSNLIQMLSDCKLIDINKSYSVGKFTKSYRPSLSIKYNLTQIIELDLSKLFKSNKTKEDYKKTYLGYEKMIDDLYLVKIDLQNFFIYVDSFINNAYKKEKGKDKILTDDLAYSIKISAIKINLGIHFFSVSSTGRIYSSIANMSSLAIPFMTLNGKEIEEIDASNCQPLLLSSLIDNRKYKEDCENGIFYKRLADHIGIERDDFKTISYPKIFFNDKKIDSKMSKIIEEVYPGLTEAINQYKAISKKEANEWRNAGNEDKFLWHKLQTLESNIFIKIAKAQLIPVVTRHDSIICAKENRLEIEKKVKKEFKKIGLKVTIKK